MRSSTEKSPALPGLTRTATTSSSYRAAARLMTSTCPLVTGSNEPGQTARLTGSDRTGAGPRRTAGRAVRSGVSAIPRAPRGWTARRRATASGASQPPLDQRPEDAEHLARRAWRRAGRRAPGRTAPAAGRRRRWAPSRRPPGRRAGRRRRGSPAAPAARAAPDSTKTARGRAPGERLEPEGARAGVQVEHGGAVEVEQRCRGELNRRLAGAVAGGPDAGGAAP